MYKVIISVFVSLTLVTALEARGVGAEFSGSRSIGGNFGNDNRANNNPEKNPLLNDYNDLNNSGGGGYDPDYDQQQYAPPPQVPNNNAPYDPVPINPPEPPLS